MSWYCKSGIVRNVHNNPKKKEKWESKYFKFRPGDRILYIEIGLYTLGGKTYTEQYEGVILCTDKYRIQFRITQYNNHLNPYKIPPEIKVEDDIKPSQNWNCQNILLNKRDYQCLNTDTCIISDKFVSHLRNELAPRAYWILARDTFLQAYINLEYQKKRCKKGSRCSNVQIEHLIQCKHN